MHENIFDEMNRENAETNAALIRQVADTMPKDEVLYDLAELYKVFGDCTRIKILYALFEAEMCVSDIAELLNMTASAISPGAAGSWPCSSSIVSMACVSYWLTLQPRVDIIYFIFGS